MSIPRTAGRARRTVALLSALGAAALAFPVGASAAGYGPQRPLTDHQIRAHDSDGVWGGYVAQGSGFTSISGSWTMPQVTCDSSNDLFAPWVGIDGYGSQTVEQTGVQVDCSSGSPVLSGWYEMYPAAPQYFSDPVSVGDSFTGSVTTDGQGNYTLTLTDNTQGWSEQTQQYLDAQNISAEAVIESPSSSYPSFSELDFTNVTVNGQVFDDFSPQAIDSGGYTETALDNGGFSIVPGGDSTRHHNDRATTAPTHGATRY
ncbi:G1 family glutamic endopeptidase [Streptacidiphilus sp. P02-A3a]|uniref:G1 family glutamic endopeptidase n=1 Tax=Streptacidiphilus sp. P02-A3a TaxID=2704468 RepID=UPI0015FC6FAA|nr:G1 family glutamic endopeptidase [Streptacidiphilus sp. P02-A3a]QMU70133.1 hypothetical protein GXP74_19760 [Streptacidiphilus sp. P02-A3a]